MRHIKKAIKNDIVGTLFLCFLLGAGFIWLGSAYDLLRIGDGEKINATVLWLTALAIFWYAYETYQLKQSTADQATTQEEIMLNEFLPILEPVAKGTAATLRNNDFNKFFIRNLGKGPAKYIEIYIGSVRVGINWSLGGGELEPVHIEAEARAAVRKIIAEGPAKLNMKITYQDIYGRKLQSDHVAWDKLGRGKTYTLRQGMWDFKNLAASPRSRKPAQKLKHN